MPFGDHKTLGEAIRALQVYLVSERPGRETFLKAATFATTFDRWKGKDMSRLMPNDGPEKGTDFCLVFKKV